MAVAVSASAGVDQARTVRKVMPKVQPKTTLVEKSAKHANVVSTSKPMTFKAPAKVDIPAGYVAVTLEAHDVWEDYDDSGYKCCSTLMLPLTVTRFPHLVVDSQLVMTHLSTRFLKMLTTIWALRTSSLTVV